MEPKAVEIEWTDACAHVGWIQEDARAEWIGETYRCKTVGYLISNTKEEVTVMTTVGADGRSSGLYQIPKGMIRKIRGLK